MNSAMTMDIGATQAGGRMRSDGIVSTQALARLKRAHGQLGAVITMIEDGVDCAQTLTQLAAVSRALDKAGFAIIATGMQQCEAARQHGAQPALTEQQLEKLFIALS